MPFTVDEQRGESVFVQISTVGDKLAQLDQNCKRNQIEWSFERVTLFKVFKITFVII